MPSRGHLSLRPALKWRAIELFAIGVRHFPTASEILSPFAGELAYLTAPRLRRNVLHNLLIVQPDAEPRWLTATCRAVFRSVARYYVEILALPRRDLQRYFSRFQVDGYEHLVGALARGRGVIVAGIHIGPAEVVLHGFAARGVPYTAMVERLEPPQLAALWLRIRQAHGQVYLYPDLTGTKRLVRTLRAGGLVALLIDRDVLGSGVEVSFCGAKLRVPAGPVQLAGMTGATIVPAVANWLPDGRLSVAILPPFELSARRKDAESVRVDVARLLAQFEPYLRRCPGQWLVLDRLWRGRPAAGSSAYTSHHAFGGDAAEP